MDYDEALRCIEKVHQYSPGGEQVLLASWNLQDYGNASDHGWALYRLGRFREAEEWFDRTERQRNPLAALGRAMTKAQLGKLKEGRPYYELGVQRLERRFVWATAALAGCAEGGFRRVRGANNDGGHSLRE